MQRAFAPLGVRFARNSVLVTSRGHLSIRIAQRQGLRSFSAALPDGWERITRRNGDVVFYNSAIRKTVRELPGIPREPNAGPSSATPAAKPAEAQAATPDTQAVPHHEPTENEVFVPIDFAKAMSIDGLESQVVHVDLEPQQCLRAETGAMIYMTDGVEMETTTAGGFQQGMKRMMTGENFFVSRFTYRGATKGTVALGTSFPSKIVHLKLADFIGNSIICQKGAFLCGSDTINIEMEFTKTFGAGFFGGEGFILQRLTGSGEVFVRASGALIERDLQPGEVLRISSGCLVAFEPTVHYDIAMMKGVKNAVFGGEGLFVTTLTGPGKIYLQSLPFDRVVSEIAGRVPHAGGHGMMFPFFGGGGGSTGSESSGAGADAAADEAAADVASTDSGDDSTSWNSSAAAEADIYGGGAEPSADSLDLGEPEEAAETIGDFFGRFFGRD